jgi:putative spermidine/putrescine transport system ATP-binding protein
MNGVLENRSFPAYFSINICVPSGLPRTDNADHCAGEDVGAGKAMTAPRGHELRLEGISHRFGAATAVDGVDLAIAGGELVALLGPSGCGKSTLLRIIAGFIAQTEGSVLFDKAAVDHLSPRHRGVGIVFQNYALFPHMTVRRNVAYGLEAQGFGRDNIATRVDEMLDFVQMRAFGDRLPRQLSGGQQQRIALARCLAINPKVLVLDEPFGALDKNLRLDMQIEIKRLQRDCGITTVIVTHDQEEALVMADRIAVMNKGRIEQFGSPGEVYDSPKTLFVSQFVGTTNLLSGDIVAASPSGAEVKVADCRLRVGPVGDIAVGRNVVVAIRPERLRLEGDAAPGTFAGTVKAVLPLGSHVVYDIATELGSPVRLNASRDAAALAIGERVRLGPSAPAACSVFPAT